MADSETVDTTQQVLLKTSPATKQKNPKRVAAGKAIAERTRQLRETQKRALAEANVIIAKNQLKQAEPPAVSTDETKGGDSESAKNVLTTTQWLSVISIAVSLAGIYYKREEIKSVFTKPPPSPVLPPAPTPTYVLTKRKEAKTMD